MLHRISTCSLGDMLVVRCARGGEYADNVGKIAMSARVARTACDKMLAKTRRC